MTNMKSFFQKYGAYWGLLFVAVLLGPYALGIWDDVGYIWVLVGVFIFILVLLLVRRVTPTFWWEGLRKKKNKEGVPDQDA